MPLSQTLLLSGNAEEVARKAADLLRDGQIVALPTETVYGLGADATNAQAVAGIYAAKKRPRFNPLIAHVASLQAAQKQGRFNGPALRLAETFWPGPLTLVLPVASSGSVCDLARGGLESVGLRIPAHPLTQRILQLVGRPVAAPSANPSGRLSPTLAEHVYSEMGGRIDAVVDGGPATVGVESTIIACLDETPRLLRPGGIPRTEIEKILGHTIAQAESAEVLAPGMLSSHYAPRARVRLNARDVRQGEAVLTFNRAALPGSEMVVCILDLSEEGNLVEAASRLFSSLRELDASGVETIAVAPIPENGLGEAINDRLRRAAAER